jgi:hypothetical protein
MRVIFESLIKLLQMWVFRFTRTTPRSPYNSRALFGLQARLAPRVSIEIAQLPILHFLIWLFPNAIAYRRFDGLAGHQGTRGIGSTKLFPKPISVLSQFVIRLWVLPFGPVLQGSTVQQKGIQLPALQFSPLGLYLKLRRFICRLVQCLRFALLTPGLLRPVSCPRESSF